jgi:hypothetical protein
LFDGLLAISALQKNRQTRDHNADADRPRVIRENPIPRFFRRSAKRWSEISLLRRL